MRLSRIFVDSALELNSKILLPTDKAHYVKNVLRLKNGHQIHVFNGRDAIDYLGEICIQGKQVRASLVSAQQTHNESPIDITLVQAVGKSEHMDYIVQKATELGVSQFLFFNSQRTQSPLKGNRLQKRIDHWQRIAISACEQCHRNSIPRVMFTADLSSRLQDDSSYNRVLLDYNGKPYHQITGQFDAQKRFQLLVGCEGGLTDSEIQLATDNGFISCVSGPRILRMETAAVSFVSIIQHHFGDLG